MCGFCLLHNCNLKPWQIAKKCTKKDKCQHLILLKKPIAVSTQK